jgi:hypothetical protein
MVTRGRSTCCCSARPLTWQPRHLGEYSATCFRQGRYDFISANDSAFGEVPDVFLFSPAPGMPTTRLRGWSPNWRAPLVDAANADTPEHPGVAVDAGSGELGSRALEQLQQTGQRRCPEARLLRGAHLRGETTDEPQR